jgi:hypothetical protein
VVLCSLTARAEAYPLLQLDIVGGSYDPVTQTTISGGPDFTLIALLTPKPTDNLAALLSDTYYISAALTPKVGPTHSIVGDYTWNGTHYDATANMTFGTPPLEALSGFDPGDFSDPDIYPTFFNEFAFQFSFDQRAVAKWVPQDAGGVTPTTATGNVSYYQMFNITTSFAGNHVLHFNVYDTYIKRCASGGPCETDVDVEHFGPLNADAESAKVPEPSIMALLAVGLALGVKARRS